MNSSTALSSSKKFVMTISRNLVTEISPFSCKNFDTAVPSALKNLVTVTSRNFVTVMSLESRKRVEAVPRNFVTEISFYMNSVGVISYSAKNLVTVISLVSKK